MTVCCERSTHLWLYKLNPAQKSSIFTGRPSFLECGLDIFFIFGEELENAESCTASAFRDEINTLSRSSDKQVKRTSSLVKLDPFFRNGPLCIVGRLAQARMSSEGEHLIILPKNSHVTSLVIDHYQNLSGHSGRHVLTLIRQKYWVVKANSTVRKVLKNCCKCRRQEAPFCEQKMADLPEDRLIPGNPFTIVGVDYLDPFQVRRSRSLVKRYGVLFTCLTVRAVHIEVAHSLDTDSFLLAFRWFIARRG